MPTELHCPLKDELNWLPIKAQQQVKELFVVIFGQFAVLLFYLLACWVLRLTQAASVDGLSAALGQHLGEMGSPVNGVSAEAMWVVFVLRNCLAATGIAF